MNKMTVKDLDVNGKRVLLRVDFNVPMDENKKITDDTRMRAALPTINYLVDQGAKVILASHLGRPKGQVNPKYSLDPVVEHLKELTGRKIRKVNDCIGDEVKKAVSEMDNGDLLLLENVRFHAEEEKNDPAFAKALAELADVYVNDAFGAAHRAHASTEGAAKHLPAAAGFLLERELEVLHRVLNNPERPFLAILGGAKVSDKIEVVSNLLKVVNMLIIGGGMANTFFKAMGYNTGKSLVEDDKVELAKNLINEAKEKGIKLLLPMDVVVADNFAADANTQTVDANAIPDGWMALDVGPKSVELFKGVIGESKMIMWNGPMGVFEMDAFAKGTEAIAQAVATANALTIVGGGDSVAAVEKMGVADKIDNILTGGGASLEYLEGKTLPGVAALNGRKVTAHA